MSLAFGHTFLAIPGPSAMPERVLRAMHRSSPNIYEGELVEMMPGLMTDLKRVARTDGHAAIYIANGHGGWEATLSNTLSRAKVLLLASGRFGPGWGAMAEAMGIEVATLDFGSRGPVDPAKVTEVLRAPGAEAYKAVLLVHTDTASSVRNNIMAVRNAIDLAGHPALLMVDCIANLGCERMEMDEWGVDVLVTGSQKGLMTPPGLAFVFYNDKAAAAHETADLVTSYWDWAPRADPAYFYQRFCGTAPTHHLFGLREALDMLVHEEGVEAAWARHRVFARAVWAAVEIWAEAGDLEPNIADRAFRSNAVTTLRTRGDLGARLRRWCQDECGLTLGIGLGLDPGVTHADDLFRIGHMGHLNPHAIMGTLGVVEAGLGALGARFGSGALGAAAAVIAEAVTAAQSKSAAAAE
ncbi:MAG: aminotransferase class V-fold PLP-dependent enzyme [Pseudomonadota bacterium]